MTDIGEAKPCPFCGGVEIRVNHASAMAFHALCRGCGARTRPFEIPSTWPEELPHDASVGDLDDWLMDKAKVAWNQRTEEPE